MERGLRGKLRGKRTGILHPNAKSNRREAGYLRESSPLEKFLGAIAVGRRRLPWPDQKLKPNLSLDR